MKDGSFQLQPLAEGAEPVDLAAGDARLTGAAFKPSTLAITDEDLGISEDERPAPTATRTITGRETALLPSDPEGATVLETADGRRIVIPKEQAVDISEVAKAAPLEGETTRRGIRMPFAALRARRAGVGKTPTEAEVEALPEAGGVRAPAPVSAEVAGAPTIGARVAPAAPTPMPAPALVATKPGAPATPTPGQEVGKDVRDAMGAPTGATAPRPVGIADGGSKASVPAMPMSALDRIRSMRLQAPPASPAQAPTVSTTEEPVAIVGQPSGVVRTPMTPKATARAEKVVEKAGMTESERAEAARRKRIAEAAAARKREQDAYMKEFMAAERASAGEVPPPTMAPYVP
jgi:hypothetical protein